jgi:endonuclease/exonuclease/phosphatase family metal-dependent hydrolase
MLRRPLITYWDSKAIGALIENKLTDTFKVGGGKWACTVPTDLLSRHKDTGVRIDYIFCSSNFKVVNAGVIKNDLTEKASDHYPIYAVLEI